MADLKLTETLDGEEWARQFIAQVEAGTLNPRSLDDVRPWFQNAIMAGHDRELPVNGDQADAMLRDRIHVV